MGRNFGATDKKKGSQKNETAIAGVTNSNEFLQKKLGDPAGIKLDQSVERASNRPVGEEL